MKLNERERQLWDRLLAYVRNGGGWIVSQPYLRKIELEVLTGSKLPDKLRDQGFDCYRIGERAKLLSDSGPVTSQAVQVYSMELPRLVGTSD